MTNIGDVARAPDDTLCIGSPCVPSAVQLRRLSETAYELAGLTYSGTSTTMRITLA